MSPALKRTHAQNSKRTFLRCLSGFLGMGIVWGLCVSAHATENEPWRHGLSLMGTPKYTRDFKHFDYVNPTAPKGGTVRLGAQGSFDSFNMVVAGIKGDVEENIARIYETLMVASQDEVSTEYGLIAESVKHPEDYSAVTYKLRPQARWHDGKPITPEDVIFSFDAFKKHSPFRSVYYKNILKAEKSGEREVTFTFDQKGNRELPQIIGQMPILPKHGWEGKNANGTERDVSQSSLDIPLGSGPYRLKTFNVGHSATYERVADYWGKDLPVNVGRYNFDQLQVEYFRDSTVLVEAFKANKFDWRAENSAKNWATAYEFPAVKEGKVLREQFPIRASGVMQAFAFNLRREMFQDANVRRAFNLAFDYESINRTIFFGQYERINSFFYGTELASSGLPDDAQKALLEPLKDKIPADALTKAYTNPTSETQDQHRQNLREANRLLTEAGNLIRASDRKRLKKDGKEVFKIEFLGFDPSLERYVLPFKSALESLGFEVSLRLVDSAQYQNRLRTFDFDLITTVWGQSLSPGNEQREYWGSASANSSGTRNLAGIQNPAVDTLIEKVIYAPSREAQITAVKALDRVLLANHYVIPQWSYRFERIARWDKFARPNELPQYGASAFPDVWWSK
jgi:microcin C transport system substrate-binding protein